MKNPRFCQFLKHLLIIPLLAGTTSVFACDACKKQQPKFLQGITHGAGPDGLKDYVIVAVMVGLTLYTLFATVRCLLKPSESGEDHVKRIILNN
ncbi:hypothetical protein [Mucilaginibacter antarcticus]|uniref:CcmD family protein n=1 Tax=Mucilaginibacter antarcticus TaxID=1855725 RepID=A0ABW5XUU2_9SPHI